MVWGEPAQNLINFQLKSNQKFMENGLGRARPESNQFQIKIELEIQRKWSRASQARIQLVFNLNLIRHSRKMVQGKPGQNLISFQLKSNQKFKENGLGPARPNFDNRWQCFKILRSRCLVEIMRSRCQVEVMRSRCLGQM